MTPTAVLLELAFVAAISWACGMMYYRASAKDRDANAVPPEEREIRFMFCEAAKHGAVALIREDGRIAVITCSKNRVSKVHVFQTVDTEDQSWEVSAAVGKAVVDHLDLDA